MSSDFIETASETLDALNSPHLIICFDNPSTEVFRYALRIHDDFGRDAQKLLNALRKIELELIENVEE